MKTNCTKCGGVIGIATNRLEFVCAGHPEPNKDFRQAVREIVEYAKGNGNCEQMISTDTAVHMILAICKEMLVPAEAVDYEEETSPRGQTYYDEGFNDCRQHLLKQLGEKA